MIKASELRIGNWINVKHPHPNNGIYEMQVKSISDEENGTDAYGSIYGTCDASLSQCTPIPITEEWLVRFGFEESGRWYCLKEYPHQINVYYTIKKVTIGMNEEYEVNIQYVHQLQNLYFALTGEELTIKEL